VAFTIAVFSRNALASDRVTILPIFFKSADVIWTTAEYQNAEKILSAHLNLAQQHYLEMLGSDTFEFSRNKPLLYAAPHPIDFYTTQSGDSVDSAHKIVKPRILS
jgi:hypothetical protein